MPLLVVVIYSYLWNHDNLLVLNRSFCFLPFCCTNHAHLIPFPMADLLFHILIILTWFLFLYFDLVSVR